MQAHHRNSRNSEMKVAKLSFPLSGKKQGTPCQWLNHLHVLALGHELALQVLLKLLFTGVVSKLQQRCSGKNNKSD